MGGQDVGRLRRLPADDRYVLQDGGRADGDDEVRVERGEAVAGGEEVVLAQGAVAAGDEVGEDVAAALGRGSSGSGSGCRRVRCGELVRQGARVRVAVERVYGGCPEPVQQHQGGRVPAGEAGARQDEDAVPAQPGEQGLDGRVGGDERGGEPVQRGLRDLAGHGGGRHGEAGERPLVDLRLAAMITSPVTWPPLTPCWLPPTMLPPKRVRSPTFIVRGLWSIRSRRADQAVWGCSRSSDPSEPSDSLASLASLDSFASLAAPSLPSLPSLPSSEADGSSGPASGVLMSRHPRCDRPG